MIMKMSPTPWEQWSDEHLTYLRALNAEHTIIEVVREKPLDPHRDPDGLTGYLHEVVFLEEYLASFAAETLNNILAGAGYNDLKDFVKWIGGPDAPASGTLTNEMKLHLAMLIAEHRADRYDIAMDDYGTSIVMSRAEAVEQVHKIVGYNGV